MRFRLLRADWFMLPLCYLCALLLCASPLVPYNFTTLPQLYVGVAALGTPLAAVGIWLNHLVERNPKGKRE